MLSAIRTYVYEFVNGDLDTDELGNIAEQLAYASIHLYGIEGGDLVETEMLVRKAVRILTAVSVSNPTISTARTLSVLADILHAATGHHDEEKSLREESLAVDLKKEGRNSSNVGKANMQLVQFHKYLARKDLPPGNFRVEVYKVAETYCVVAVRIANLNFGPRHERTIDFESRLLEIRKALYSNK